MSTSPQECARQILEVTPVILQTIRAEMRRTRSSDLTVPQFRTLRFIESNPGASLSAVAEFIGLTLSSMSILVNALVDRNLVLRTTDDEDRRRVQLTLTPVGQTLLGHALDATEAHLAEIVRTLSDQDRTVIVEGMQLLRPLFAPTTLTLHREVSLEGNPTP